MKRSALKIQLNTASVALVATCTAWVRIIIASCFGEINRKKEETATGKTREDITIATLILHDVRLQFAARFGHFARKRGDE